MIDDSQWKTLLKGICEGLPITSACAVAQISRTTYYQYLKDDEKFAIEVSTALAKFQSVHLKRLDDHSKSDWKASAWLLERKFPNDFALRSQVDLTTRGQTLNAPTWFGKEFNDVKELKELKENETTDNLLSSKE